MTTTILQPSPQLALLLTSLAQRYEQPQFLEGDPSFFMHQVQGTANQEVTAFVASCLSYGSRRAFLPKIQFLVDLAHGDLYQWVTEGLFRHQLPDDSTCFYRLYSHHAMQQFFEALLQLLRQYGSLGQWLRHSAQQQCTEHPQLTALQAIETICHYFAEQGITGIVPKNTTSCCKRVCMFLRWMVRTESPIDLGLWADFIDQRTLIMPLDTHVVQQSIQLGLLKSASTSMSAALRLTKILAMVFPNDPLKADFALFGYGVDPQY